MTALTNTDPNVTYKDLYQTGSGTGTGLTASLQSVTDGAGNTCPLQLSTTGVNIVSGFTYNGNALSFAGATTFAGANSVTITSTATTNSTLPAGTHTLVGQDTTDTLTNKTLVAPVLGTPISGTLTNCTGLPISTGVSGLGTGVATFLGSPSSANLLAALTTKTGTGNAVFATSPTLVTPVLGVATATSYNGLTIGTTTGTLNVTNGKTLSVTGTATISTTPVTTMNTQTITATGSYTYTPTSGCIAAIFRLQAGGGGTGGTTGTGGQNALGGPGGGGGYLEVLVTGATNLAACSGSIGIAGTAGASGNNAGGNGGNTTLIINSGTTWTAGGGVGGGGQTSSVNTAVSGSAGTGGTNTTGTNGTLLLNSPGGNAILGMVIGNTGISAVASGMSGSGTSFGSGGIPLINFTASNQPGVAGKAGIVTIIEYIAQ